MFRKNFVACASLCAGGTAQGLISSPVFETDQSGMIEIKLEIQCNTGDICVSILLLFGKSDILSVELALLTSTATEKEKKEISTLDRRQNNIFV